jgi:hypothetical protein
MAGGVHPFHIAHGSGRGVGLFHAFPSMVISTAPRCEIRALVLHIYPDGIKAYGHERITQPVGRSGKPVKKIRYMPAARAHALARKLQGQFGTTVSVL